MFNPYTYQRLVIWAFLLFALVIGNASFAQSNIERFGHNRLQYRKFDWKYFDTKHFRVYHYDKSGRQLGRYVAEECENNISIIERRVGGKFPDRFNIILYNSYDEYKQNNVGIRDESQVADITISQAKNLVGDKLVVYFTGDHTDLKRQIRAGMAIIVMQQNFYGESFKKMMRTNFLLDLPQWTTDGYLAYLVDGWNTESNSEWKRLLDARPKTGFHQFSLEYPELAGRAFWKYISATYGNRKVKDLLMAMQQSSSVSKTLKDKAYLGIKVRRVYDSCIAYYKKIYAIDSTKQELPDSTNGLISLKVPNDGSVIKNVMLSPKGTDIAYVAWKHGQYTIYTQKTAGDQVKSVLLEGGDKDFLDDNDPNYPMMTWSNTGNKLAIVFKKDRKTRIRIYNSIKGKIENYIIPAKRFDRLLGMTFMEDDSKMIFSAIKNSQTDLYTFIIKGAKVVNITNDAWDDLNPVYVSGGSRTGILFLSNRPAPNMEVPQGVNQLPNGVMNVFFYNTTTERKELLQCSKISSGKISQPIQYGYDNFAYLYDGNGINNKYVVMFGRTTKNMDSAYALPVTNYNTSVISHQFNLATGGASEVVQVKNKYILYSHKLDFPSDTFPKKPLLPTTLSLEAIDTEVVVEGVNVIYDNPITDTVYRPLVKTGNTFQTEFTDTTSGVAFKLKKNAEDKKKLAADVSTQETKEADSSTLNVINDSAYLKMKPTKYRLSFKPGQLNVRLDNSTLFNRYQSYANNQGQYKNPGISALATIDMLELMENHKLTAGFQLPVDMAQSTWFLQYNNYKRRADWSLLLMRTQWKDNIYVGYTDSSGVIRFQKQQLFQNISTLGQFEWSYPLDKMRSIRFTTAYKQDKLVQKAQDTLSLKYEIPNTQQDWSMTRLEYVYDNTIAPLLNIRMGTRFKIYSEYMNQLNGTNQSCYNIGLDFRTYQKLYKNMIWATRVAYAHSDGTAQVQYQLGGVDNWISAKTAQTPSGDGTYGFIALSTSLRGYLQAARKGNNVAVMSSEVRLPVANTFIKRPISSGIIKELQLIAFTDIGSTWNGFLPSAESYNTTYTYIYGANGFPSNVQVQVQSASSTGLGIGYGLGLRTKLMGYFVRCDAAWNIEGSTKPQIYFAFGTDF